MKFSTPTTLRQWLSAATLFTLPTVSALAAPTVAFQQPNPSNDEQYMLELINAARANPPAEGTRLADATEPDILQNYTYFAVSPTLLVTQFDSIKAEPPLAFNSMLMASAKEQSDDQSTNGFQGHDSSNGTTFDARITAEGYSWSFVGENVYSYSKSAYYGHVAFNADWGVPSLDHRANIMNTDASYPLFREIGISCVAATNAKVGPMVITEDFGTPSASGTAYLLGVVYNDSDNSHSYTSGEGLGGVTVMPASGTYFATTSSSGGFVIPLPTTGSGTMTVTAYGGALGGARVKTVAWTAGTNVKVDFTTNDTVSAGATNTGAFFTGAKSLGSGVYYLDFASGNYFGYYSYMSDPNYIYHFDMGYEYVTNAFDGKSGVYLYDFKSGTFFYTSPTYPFPYMYDFSRRSVVYYYPSTSDAGHYNTNGVRYFYDCSTGQTFSK